MWQLPFCAFPWASNIFRVLNTVDDYLNTVKKWNVTDLEYNIDETIYQNVDAIPCNIKQKEVKSYNHNINERLIILTTI